MDAMPGSSDGAWRMARYKNQPLPPPSYQSENLDARIHLCNPLRVLPEPGVFFRCAGVPFLQSRSVLHTVSLSCLLTSTRTAVLLFDPETSNVYYPRSELARSNREGGDGFLHSPLLFAFLLHSDDGGGFYLVVHTQPLNRGREILRGAPQPALCGEDSCIWSAVQTG